MLLDSARPVTTTYGSPFLHNTIRYRYNTMGA